MKTVRKLIYGEVLAAIAFVALGFLALFLFFDLVEELQYLGKGPGGNVAAGAGSVYQLKHALLYVALLIPTHLYELLPISVLIGTIFVMSRLAQSSEYTILRTSGLDPWRALKLLLALGGAFVAISFVVGDYLAPMSDHASQLLKARYQGRITVGQTGAWLKEKQNKQSFVVNVKALSPNRSMQGLRIFAFDEKGRPASMTEAPQADFSKDGWVLKQALRTEFSLSTELTALPNPSAVVDADKVAAQDTAKIDRQVLSEFVWPTEISADMVAVALLKPDSMGTVDLFNYMQHLRANGQTTQRYEIEFWKKVFYPMSCLVMVMLALPFAYFHFRSGSMATQVFCGVMFGISFFLLNNVFGYIGNLQNWWPWLAAAAPGLLYSALSLSAFAWLVIRQ